MLIVYPEGVQGGVGVGVGVRKLEGEKKEGGGGEGKPAVIVCGYTHRVNGSGTDEERTCFIFSIRSEVTLRG